MPDKNSDLHQNAPDKSDIALIVIDMINDLEYPGGECIFDAALAAANRIAALKARAKTSSIPVIYANDNFGRWRSDFREAVRHCIEQQVRGNPVVTRIEPDATDYFVLKPKYSAFYATAMETLLTYLGSKHLILTGITGNMCVQFTACDAYMRDYHIHIPQDCIASNSEEENQRALAYMQDVLNADIRLSEDIDLTKLR